MNNVKSRISAGTVARTICLALALLNQLLTVFGLSPLPIEDETVNLLVSTVATVIAAAVSGGQNAVVAGRALAAGGYVPERRGTGRSAAGG